MKQNRETVFIKALGGIPQSYIDELTAWQQEHAPASDTDAADSRRKPDAPVQRAEKITMNRARTAEINPAAGISVRRLRPITAGIFAALAACAVVAVGFGTGFFRRSGITMQTGSAPDVSAADPDASEVEETTTSFPPYLSVSPELAQSGDWGIEVPISDDAFVLSDSSDSEIRLDADDDQIVNVFSHVGKSFDFPDIPTNGAMLFTAMDDLRPVLERAADEEITVKGIQHTEPVFEQGRNVLILKIQNTMHTWNPHLRALYITADHVLHADVETYDNLNDLVRCPDEYPHYYMMISVPATLTEIRDVSVTVSGYYSEYQEGSGISNYDPLLDDYGCEEIKGMRLQHLEKNNADYVFPEHIYELYTEDEIGETYCKALGTELERKDLPEDMTALMQRASGILQNKTGYYVELHKVPYDNSDESPVIIRNSADDAGRELIMPEKGYTKEYLDSINAPQLNHGTRITIIRSDEIRINAKLTDEGTIRNNPDA